MKLNHKILMLILGSALISGGGNYFLTQKHAEELYLDTETLLITTLFYSLRDTLIEDIINENKLKVTEQLRNLEAHENPVEFLYVSTNEEQVFSHSFINGFPRYLLTNQQRLIKSNNFNELPDKGMVLIGKYQTPRGVIYEYRGELIKGLGTYLHIAINQSKILTKLSHNKQEILQLSLFFLLLLLIAVYFFTKRLTAPLVALTTSIKTFTETKGKEANFDFVSSSFSEINKVAAAFKAAIDQQHQTTCLLKEREQYLATTLNSIGDAVITTDEKGNVLTMNPVAEQLTGWQTQDAKTKPIKDIFPIIDASSRKVIDNPIDKVLNTGQTVYLSNHTTLIAKNGTEYQISDSAAPILNNGDILGMVLVFNNVTEQYKLKQAEREMQSKLQHLFSDMQTMVAISSPSGAIRFANNHPLQVAGIEFTEVENKNIWDSAWFNYDQSIQQQVKDACLKALNGESTLQDIQIFTKKSLLWVAYSVHPVCDNQGEIVELLHEARDINQRKFIEENNNNTLRELKLYQEQAPIAYIVWDINFRVTSWNKAAERIFGYSFLEVKGKTAEIIIPQSEKSNISGVWQSLITEKGGKVSINNNITKSGKSVCCEWHNTVLKDEFDNVIGAVSLILDVTNEHELHRQLVTEKQEQKEILDSVAEGIISFDVAGNILNINKTAEILFGYSINAAAGKNIEEIINVEQGNITQLIEKVKVNKEFLKGVEFSAIQQHGGTFPVKLLLSELPYVEGKCDRFVGVFQDLTLLKQQEGNIRRSQKMDALGKLTGGIAHDYNNMLGVIIGYTDILMMKLVDQPKLLNYVEQINMAGNRGADLTRKLLSVSNQQPAETTIENLNTLIEKDTDLLRKTLVLINLNLELYSDLWQVEIDANSFEDSLLNITINAMHAMTNGGSLTITTANVVLTTADAALYQVNAGDYVSLSIEDTGCGMTEQLASKIFEPFYSTKGAQGSGLGLSQVYAFVQSSGGTVMVNSQLGIGTQFILYFPRYKKTAKIATTELKTVTLENIALETQPTQVCGGTETILIVDDEVQLCSLAEEILASNGYKVLTANDGKQALNILENHAVDLLFTDIVMPEMNGYQLAEKTLEKYPSVEVLFATGYRGDNEITNITIDEPILTKPYTTNELLLAIRTSLDSCKHALDISQYIVIDSEEKTQQFESNKSSNTLSQSLWSNKMLVDNNGVIDKEHEVIFDLFSQCTQMIGNECLPDVKALFNTIKGEFIKHCKDEERAMKLSQYPYMKNHVSVHNMLIKELKNTLDTKADNDILLWISTYFAPLFAEHVMVLDKALTPYLLNNGNQEKDRGDV